MTEAEDISLSACPRSREFRSFGPCRLTLRSVVRRRRLGARHHCILTNIATLNDEFGVRFNVEKWLCLQSIRYDCHLRISIDEPIDPGALLCVGSNSRPIVFLLNRRDAGSNPLVVVALASGEA